MSLLSGKQAQEGWLRGQDLHLRGMLPRPCHPRQPYGPGRLRQLSHLDRHPGLSGAEQRAWRYDAKRVQSNLL